MIWDDNEDICVVHCKAKRRVVQEQLDALREERRPYLFLTDKMQTVSELRRILVPVTMLEEEVYKAEICTYLARKTGATIVLLRANDYGSHARQNTQRIITHIQTVAERTGEQIHYEELVGQKDSFHLNQESAQRCNTIANGCCGGTSCSCGETSSDTNLDCQLLLLTASREYGLDDWLFGPPERYAILHSPVPVMLINPRADLFSLCD